MTKKRANRHLVTMGQGGICRAAGCFSPSRANSIYCSGACQKRASRAKGPLSWSDKYKEIVAERDGRFKAYMALCEQLEDARAAHHDMYELWYTQWTQVQALPPGQKGDFF